VDLLFGFIVHCRKAFYGEVSSNELGEKDGWRCKRVVGEHERLPKQHIYMRPEVMVSQRGSQARR
jgi:hypothetical protein